LSSVEAIVASPLASSVDSSAIARIAYNERGQKLFVTFRAGTYTYFDVPREVYEALMAAASKGAFFNTRIRDRYDFKAPQNWAVQRGAKLAARYVSMRPRRPALRP
jgi:hypothetical protein